MRFWFRFISPYYEEIDSVDLINARRNFDRDFYTYLGEIFEDICREVVADSGILDHTQMRRWWWKENEIDFAAVNEETG